MLRLGMVVYTCDLSTQETNAGELPQVEASQGYTAELRIAWTTEWHPDSKKKRKGKEKT